MSRITLDAGLFHLVVRVLRRDQESGLAVRGEIADELEQDAKPERDVCEQPKEVNE